MNKSDLIKKINKSIVHEDGTIDSFDKQLIQLMSGVYDTRFPLVVAEDTSALNYIETLSVENPLIINPSTVIKLREKHDIGYEFVSNCEKYLEESVLAFDSLQHKSSKVILLQEVDDDGFPMVAICRDNKDIGGNLMINEVTSIYDKKNLESLINRTYEDNKMFFKNKKTEQYIKSIGLQLSKGLITALSDNYNKASFNKNQVEADLKPQVTSTVAEDLSKINTGHESDFDYISLDDSGKIVTIAYLNKEGHSSKGNIVVDEYDIDFLREYAQQHGNETLYNSASEFAKEIIEDNITQADKYLDGEQIDSKITLNELIEKIDEIYLDNLSVDVHEYSDPFIFDDGDYYFEYEIFYKDKLIASGQDSIEGTDETDVDKIKEDIRNHLHYYVSKPNIHNCGKIMQDCFEICISSESGMCFMEAEFMDEYSDEDVKIFFDDVEKYKLMHYGVIETCLSVEDAKETGVPFATCYGALGNFFNNVTSEQQQLTNVIMQTVGKCNDLLVRDETEMDAVEKNAGIEL